MLLLRYGITVSAVLGLIFLAESSVKAQTQSAADLLKKPQPIVNPVSQLPGPSAAPATTEADPKAPNYLNPSGNPLIFPTKPDEVNIRVVQPLTLNQAIELALKNNQTLQTARVD